MASKKIALAYCIDNLPVAEALYNAFSQTSYSVVHYYCKKNADELTLAEQLRDFDGTILLLISDNFLRSEDCMNRALQLVQQKSGSILPVVIDGRTKDEATGQWVNTPTKFERIGDIIPYINFWQNKYLDLRSQKRKFEAEHDAEKHEELNENLRILRQVSSEASEFLRVLRNIQYHQYADFIQNHLRAFFDFVEDPAGWSALQASAPLLTVSIQEQPIAVEPGKSPESEIAAETQTETPISELYPPSAETPVLQDDIAAPASELDEPLIEQPIADIPPVELPIFPESTESQEWTGAELAENLEDLGVVIAEHSSTVEDIPLEIPALESTSEVIEPPVVQETDGLIENLHADSPAGGIQSPDELTLADDDEDHGSKVSDLIQQARGLVASGQVEGGINYMKQAIKAYPGSADLHYFFGLILAQNTRDLSGALEHLVLATEIDPEHEAAFFLLGELAEHQGDFASARKYYERLVDINEDFLDVFYRLGTVLQSAFPEELEYAAQCFKKATKRNPANADAHYQYASILGDVLGKMEPAEAFFLKTLAIQPKHPFANYDLALIYHTAGDAAKALQSYEAAIANNPELQTPENEIAFRGLGVVPEVEPVSEEIAAETFEEPENEALEVIEEAVPEDSATLEVEDPLEDTAAEPLPEAIPETAELHDDVIAESIVDATATEEPLGAIVPELSPLLSAEYDTIETLKQNILRLEELLQAKAALEAVEEEPVAKAPAKTALITGATSGIGLASARVFAQAGWRLIITGRREDRLEAVRQELLALPDAEVLGLVFDVRDYSSVAQSIEELPEAWRSIDLLINNAGKAKGLSEIQEGNLEHWEEMIDTNLKGLLYLTRCVSPLMVAQHRGHIINIGSIAGKEPYPMGNVYCASKAAVDMLTRAMRMDLYKYNIRVSQIAPGHVEDTEFALVRFDGDAERAKIYNDFQPLNSTDVANTIFYMATQPSHVNIQDVVIYGTQQASATLIDRSGRV